MRETRTGCANCWFYHNGQCHYADYCTYSLKWSNRLHSFVPVNYWAEQMQDLIVGVGDDTIEIVDLGDTIEVILYDKGERK